MTDLNDLLVTSPDQNNERLETLKRLFPDLFTNEGKLDPVELKRLLEDEATTDKEQYTFTWRGKGKAKKHAFTPSRAALTYDPKRSVNPDNADGNMIIEGENLEVLKLLTSAYREQVKCVYIDPPYNTGGDFIYPDNYTKDKREYWEEDGSYQNGVKLDTNPETSGRYHSDWLSMMYSRLLVARQLLKNDGVIFVSIDDNEVHNLRKLMDEIFGEDCFISDITIVSNLKGRNDKKYIATANERMLMYVKSDEFEETGLKLPQAQVDEYKYKDEKGEEYREIELRKRGGPDTRQERPNMYYSFYVDLETGEVRLERTDKHTIEVLPVKSNGVDGRWRWGIDTSRNRLNLLVGKQLNDGSGYRIYEKDYLHGSDGIRRIKPKSVMLGSKYSTDVATKNYKKIMPDVAFTNPKSVTLIQDIVEYATNDGDYILDFFAGSGTTAHAVMELNQLDKRNRKFILVQLPEAIDEKHEAYKAGYRTISQITIERCKRVIKGYGNDPQPLDTGFKVYRLTKSHFPRAEFQPDPDKSNEENVELLKQYITQKEASFHMAFEQEDVFDEVLLKHGFKLDYKLTKQEEFSKNAVYLVQEEGDHKAYICLDTTIANETIDFFKTHTDVTFICLERALDTTKKWNLNHTLGERLKAI